MHIKTDQFHFYEMQKKARLSCSSQHRIHYCFDYKFLRLHRIKTKFSITGSKASLHFFLFFSLFFSFYTP